jgi:hypothetical protein
MVMLNSNWEQKCVELKNGDFDWKRKAKRLILDCSIRDRVKEWESIKHDILVVSYNYQQ